MNGITCVLLCADRVLRKGVQAQCRMSWYCMVVVSTSFPKHNQEIFVVITYVISLSTISVHISFSMFLMTLLPCFLFVVCLLSRFRH